MANNDSERFETLIIGAGQAGLAVGYHLKTSGRSVMIMDANERIGDSWRQRWDSLRAFTPARYDGLPGWPFPARDGRIPRKTRWPTTSRRMRLDSRFPSALASA